MFRTWWYRFFTECSDLVPNKLDILDHFLPISSTLRKRKASSYFFQRDLGIRREVLVDVGVEVGGPPFADGFGFAEVKFVGGAKEL